MKSNRITSNLTCLFVLSLLLAACHTEKGNEDQEAMKKVLTGYFDGIEHQDTTMMKALTTDDFLLFETGEVWNNDSVFRNIRKHMPFRVKYRIGDIRIHQDEHSGDIVYSNHADFVFRGSIKKSFDWIESATFRKTAGGWKMDFLHSTERAPRYDTIRYFREHYAARVKLFREAPLKKGVILFIGNSITEFGDWQHLTGDTTAVNQGVAADNSFGVLDRLDLANARQPRKLFLEIGINDIGQGIPVPVIQENIYAIVARVKAASPASQVYVISVLRTNDNVRQDYPELIGKNGLVDFLDDGLRRNAADRGFVYVDLKRELSDANGDLDRKYAQPDGLHLNAAGYRVWIGLLKAKGYL